MIFSNTIIIIVVTAALSFMAFKNRELQQDLIFYPPAVAGGQFFRFFTHGFIHADFNHLLFNMFTLYWFGSIMERLYNQYLWGVGFFVFYLFAIIVAILPSYFKHRNNPAYASLGASGAVSAVLFSYILIAPWSTLSFFGLVPVPAIVFAILYVAYSLYAQKHIADNINHSAHLWGGVYGVMATIFLRPDFAATFLLKLFNPNL